MTEEPDSRHSFELRRLSIEVQGKDQIDVKLNLGLARYSGGNYENFPWWRPDVQEDYQKASKLGGKRHVWIMTAGNVKGESD